MSDLHSDPLDLGADLAQREREAGLEAVRQKIKPIQPSEICLQCEEPTQSGARWCSKSCRDDWMKWNPEA